MTVAWRGMTSDNYVRTMLTPRSSASVLISLGLNDTDDMATLENLRRVRTSVHAKRVFWLLPGIKPRAREAIRTVAVEYDDFLVDSRFEVGADHVHPAVAGYRFLAGMVP